MNYLSNMTFTQWENLIIVVTVLILVVGVFGGLAYVADGLKDD